MSAVARRGVAAPRLAESRALAPKTRYQPNDRVIPRLSDEHENEIRRRQLPAGTDYVNDTIHVVSVILYWTGENVEAIDFLIG